VKEEIVERKKDTKKDSENDSDGDGNGNGIGNSNGANDSNGNGNGDDDDDDDDDGNGNGNGNGNGDGDNDDENDDNSNNDGEGDVSSDSEDGNIAELFKNVNYKYHPHDPAALRFSHLPISVSRRYRFVKAERIQAGQLDEWKAGICQAAAHISSFLSTKNMTNSRSKKAMKQMQQELQQYVSHLS
jgi:hypothetical protein